MVGSGCTSYASWTNAPPISNWSATHCTAWAASGPTSNCGCGQRPAAEATYDESGTLDELRAVVDEARALGDATALAESLSLLHHAMLTPRYARERLDVANELVGVSAAFGDRTFALMGMLWRTVDLFLLGDGSAERALADLRLRADECDFAVGQYVVRGDRHHAPGAPRVVSTMPRRAQPSVTAWEPKLGTPTPTPGSSHTSSQSDGSKAAGTNSCLHWMRSRAGP